MATKKERPAGHQTAPSETLIQKLVRIALGLLKKQQRLDQKLKELEDD